MSDATKSLSLYAAMSEAAHPRRSLRLIAVWLIGLALPLLVALIPAKQTLSRALDSSLGSSPLNDGIDLRALVDLGLALHARSDFAALTSGALASLLVTAILTPWITAAAVAQAASTTPLSTSKLLSGGFSYYLAMVRLYLWSLVSLVPIVVLSRFLFARSATIARDAVLVEEARPSKFLAYGVTLALLVLWHLALELARAEFAKSPTRRSAVFAWFDGVLSLAKRPSLGFVYGFFSLAGLSAAALLALFRIRLGNSSLGGGLGVFLLASGASAVVAWSRIARIRALALYAPERPRRSSNPENNLLDSMGP